MRTEREIIRRLTALKSISSGGWAKTAVEILEWVLDDRRFTGKPYSANEQGMFMGYPKRIVDEYFAAHPRKLEQALAGVSYRCVGCETPLQVAFLPADCPKCGRTQVVEPQ